MTTLPLEKISAASENFLLQSYPQHLRRFCRHPLLVGLLFVCLSIVVPSITTSIFGGLTAGAKVYLIEDRGIIPITLFGFAVFYYYFRMPKYFSAMLTKLRNDGIFASDEIKIGAPLTRLVQDSRLLRVGPFILPAMWVVSAILLFPYNMTKDTFWWQISPINYVIVQFNAMLVCFSLSGLVISATISGASLNSIFNRNEVKVYSLHPDRSGGFSPVGNFSLRLTAMAFLTGITVGFMVWQSIAIHNFRSDLPLFLLYAIAYLVIVPTLFYLPIRGAHKAMVAYRDDLIKQTYARYSIENLSKYDLKSKEMLTNLGRPVEQMDILKKLAKHESAYPVWPFGYRTRIGVFINAILPLTFTLTGVFVDNMLRS